MARYGAGRSTFEFDNVTFAVNEGSSVASSVESDVVSGDLRFFDPSLGVGEGVQLRELLECGDDAGDVNVDDERDVDDVDGVDGFNDVDDKDVTSLMD